MKKTLSLSNKQIIDIVGLLNDENSILKSGSSYKKLPISIWWLIDGNFSKLKEINNRVAEKERKINDEYFDEEHSFLSEDGKERFVKFEYREEFTKKKVDLYEIMNDIDIDTIDIKELADYNLPPKDYASIKFMLTDESNPERS